MFMYSLYNFPSVNIFCGNLPSNFVTLKKSGKHEKCNKKKPKKTRVFHFIKVETVGHFKGFWSQQVHCVVRFNIRRNWKR